MTHMRTRQAVVLPRRQEDRIYWIVVLASPCTGKRELRPFPSPSTTSRMCRVSGLTEPTGNCIFVWLKQEAHPPYWRVEDKMCVLCIEHKHPPKRKRKVVTVTVMLHVSGSVSYFTYSKCKDARENDRSKKQEYVRVKCCRLHILLESRY